MKKIKPVKRLTNHIAYRAGRNNRGRVAVRNRGGRHKRLYRTIDFMRQRRDISGKITSIEYDPNRGVDIALTVYPDGDKHYILAPEGIIVGQSVIAGETAPVALGNALPLKKIPIGTLVHNVELRSGAGGVIARGAGNSATVMSREGDYTRVKLPSGEVRMINAVCYATIGQLSNVDRKHKHITKAGTMRHLGFRPKVRGVAQDPGSHPHGGGEGRSGIGMPAPKTPWGKRTLGKRTRSRRKQNRFIIERRKK